MPPILFILIYFFGSLPAQQGPGITKITGVNKGKTLFIQNPYDHLLKTFCIQEVLINDRYVPVNPNSSAIKLDFTGFDLNVPVFIKIIHKDSCSPVIINPDAIYFHSVFSYDKVNLTDSTLAWTTKGEQAGGNYIVEKIESNGLWGEEAVIESTGKFEGSSYSHFPTLETGPNKYRIKYNFPDGNHLYTEEIDFHYYPDPVTFKPAKTDRYIYFSRSSPYKVYDGKGTLVLDGTAKEIDVALLPNGVYVIYFDGKDPGVFTKEYKPK